jgi:hypothetical protein
MDYDDHEDFNKARTFEESTQQFADEREAVYAKASADFAGGIRDGIVYFTIGALMFLLFLAVT